MGWAEHAHRPCRMEGEDRGNGWVGCGHHPKPPEVVDAFAPTRDLLAEVIRLPEWPDLPPRVQRLIERAWVQTGIDGKVKAAASQ